MKDPLFVFYWTDKRYCDLADQLAASLKRFDLDFQSHAVIDMGDWMRNNYLKPTFLLKMMQENPRRTIVLLDADMIVEKEPLMLIRRGKSWRTVDIDLPMFCGKVVGGPLLVRNTPSVRAFIEYWAEETRKVEYGYCEMTVLGRCFDLWAGKCDSIRARWEGIPEPLVFSFLPPSYFWVEEQMRTTYPDSEVVIRHLAVSRDKWPGMKG